MRRMDRYNKKDLSNTSSRRDKNEELYKEVSSNVKYTNITDVANANAYDISDRNISSNSTREEYHKLKDYANIDNELREKKQLDEFKYLYKEKENKIYDINTVMEEARKNRPASDISEMRRKLQNTNYNILAGLNKEELEKYRKEKEMRKKGPDEEELREIIDTITTKTLAGDISKETSINLLSDLMATQALDGVAAQVNAKENELNSFESKYQTIVDEKNDKLNSEDLKEIEEKKDEEFEEETGNIMKKADTDFYTKSMDLSDKDFNVSDEFDEKSMPILLKIFIFLILSAIIVGGAFYIYIHYFK